eukprot:COSAG01_NODE_743_length_13881_cov_8.038456_2_plen_121_part_00
MLTVPSVLPVFLSMALQGRRQIEGAGVKANSEVRAWTCGCMCVGGRGALSHMSAHLRFACSALCTGAAAIIKSAATAVAASSSSSMISRMVATMRVAAAAAAATTTTTTTRSGGVVVECF